MKKHKIAFSLTDNQFSLHKTIEIIKQKSLPESISIFPLRFITDWMAEDYKLQKIIKQKTVRGYLPLN